MRRTRSALASVVCAIALLMALAMPRAAGITSGNTAFAAESDASIRVTAVVTDQRGRPLTGLKPADFDLLVDGKPLSVDVAELSVPTSTTRAFAFFLDEFHTPLGDSTAIRDALLRFVDQMKPTDVAVAIKPLDPLTTIRLTPDRDRLRQVIATFEGRKGDYAPRTAFERNYMAQAPAAVASARGQIVTSALRAIGLALSQSTATPAIVLVSDGFERMRTGREVPANLQSVVRVANRAGAPVYSFAPTLTAPGAEPDATERGINALRTLSAETGGDLVIGTTALQGGLSRMMRDLDSHYVLTYKPPHGNDGKFHALSIAVKRAGAQVRARTGYVAASPIEMGAAASATALPTRILRRSSLIQSWSGITPLEPGRAAVTLTWEPSTRFGVPPTRRAASIVLTASLTDGTVLFDGVVSPATAAPTSTVPNRATFDAPAGRVLVDIRILDAAGVVLDNDARDVTVPSIKKESPTLFPPEIIRLRSAREFREAIQNPTTAPTAARDFRRTERLLFRVPALDPSGAPATVTAALLNRLRQSMRSITPLDQPPTTQGITLFDLPLASLAPGEYTVRFSVVHNGTTVSEHVTFRVQG